MMPGLHVKSAKELSIVMIVVNLSFVFLEERE
jgi:hypothetical protein